MSIMQSVATLLGRHAESKASQASATTRTPRPASTAARVSKLDEIFGDIVSSLDTPVGDQFDTAAAAIAHLVESIDAEQETVVATAALLSFRNAEEVPVSPDATTAGQSCNSDDTVSDASGRKTDPSRRHLGDGDAVPVAVKPAVPCISALPPLASNSASKPRHIADSSASAAPAPRAPTQISAALASLQRAPQLDSEASDAAGKKRYRAQVPSTHCHICCRPSRSVPVLVCANIAEGSCRKSICSLCVREYKLGEWESASRPDSGWVCCHCVNSCASVSRAQCFVYKRTNMKRKQASADRKRQKALSSATFPGAEKSKGLD